MGALRARQMIGDYLFDRMTLERNELIRLRERVAGLLERNTSLVHTKRDLEARVKELEEYVGHYRGAQGEALDDKVKLHNELRTTKARLKATETEWADSRATTERLAIELNRLVPGRGGEILLGVPTRDIPIREIPICSRRDAN